MTQQDAVTSVVRWHWRLLAALLILGSASWHITYLIRDCPLDLSPDEAHYWDWSRRLDWSYYSKGPLVAYLIRAGCELAGPLSQRLIGSEMLAVRLPAIICGSLLLLGLYVLTTQVYRREGLAVVVVTAALTFPIVSAGSLLMTIDAPFTCCWCWALVLGRVAVIRNSIWAWLGTGLLVGLGILAKYTMVLWIPSMALFLLTTRKYRPLLGRRGFWLMLGVTALVCLPIVIWNVRNDWVAVKHVLRLAGASPGDSQLHWFGPIHYLATQFGLFLGYWFVAWAVAMIAHRPWREPNPELRYLWWLSAPVFAVFLMFSLKTGGGEPNWPVVAYLSGMVLAAGWLARQVQAREAWYRRLAIGGLASACALGLGMTLLLHYSAWAYPVLARFSTGDLRVRKLDPTCRLRGWRTLASEVDRRRAEVRANGIEPLIAGSGWSLPGELAFYCHENPPVYSFGRAFGDRCSQYDLWPNPLGGSPEFIGRTFIVVGHAGPVLRALFEEVDTPTEVTYRVADEPVARWSVSVCRGFKGCPQALTAGQFGF
jgi:hypothetical protein